MPRHSPDALLTLDRSHHHHPPARLKVCRITNDGKAISRSPCSPRSWKERVAPAETGNHGDPDCSDLPRKIPRPGRRASLLFTNVKQLPRTRNRSDRKAETKSRAPHGKKANIGHFRRASSGIGRKNGEKAGEKRERGAEGRKNGASSVHKIRNMLLDFAVEAPQSAPLRGSLKGGRTGMLP